MALTRNIVSVMAPVIATHGILAYCDRFLRPFPRRQQIVVAGTAVLAFLLTWLWPVIVGLSTGIPDAYNQTMAAWRIEALELKIGIWWDFLYLNYGIAGQVLGPLVVIAFTWFMFSRHSWRWGPEIWGWAGAYPAYILLVTTSGPSRMRYALLAWPFALIIAQVLDLPWWRRWRWWLLGLIAVAGCSSRRGTRRMSSSSPTSTGSSTTPAGSGGGAGQVEPGDAEIGQQQPQQRQGQPDDPVVVALDAADEGSAQAVDGERPGDVERFARGDIALDLGVGELGEVDERRRGRTHAALVPPAPGRRVSTSQWPVWRVPLRPRIRRHRCASWGRAGLAVDLAVQLSSTESHPRTSASGAPVAPKAMSSALAWASASATSAGWSGPLTASTAARAAASSTWLTRTSAAIPTRRSAVRRAGDAEARTKRAAWGRPTAGE